MKKTSCLFIIVLLALLSISFGAVFAGDTNGPRTVIASGSCGDDLTWELSDEGFLTIAGTGMMYNYSTNNSNRAPWCSNETPIKSVSISEGVTGIGNYAFHECADLASIDVPNSMTSIGSGAFYGCSSLTSIMIPDGVNTIGNSAFSKCINMTSIQLPGSITSIAYGSFSGCTSLMSVSIPNNVTTIKDSAFDGCTNLTSVTIPNSVTTIELFAFARCSSLPNITLPNSVTELGEYAFFACRNMKVIVLSENIANIKENTFKSCACLESIIIPQSVESIGDSAFENCSSLKDITIPESINNLGTKAFYNCSSLSSIEIPGNITKIQTSAFENCSNLKTVTVKNGVTIIDSSAFRGCSALTDVTVPNSVTSIGSDAFRGCSALKSIEIPEGIGKIETSTFYGCSNLTNISIPESVTSIGNYAFSGCNSLLSITVPEGVTSIGSSAFSGCSSLSSITIPFVGGFETATGNYAKLSYIFGTVPDSLREVIVTGGSQIGDNAFSGCEGLTSVLVPEGITGIGDGAFSNCSGLTSFTIPGNVTSIGYAAFSGCSGLTSLTIPEGVTSIGSRAFSRCGNLTSITVPNSVTSIGSGVFSECNCLVSVSLPFVGGSDSEGYSSEQLAFVFETIPDSLREVVITGGTRIGDRAFSGCDGLTSLIIPEGVTIIGEYAFSDCSGLATFTVPASVTIIGNYAFSGCSGLTNIIISEGVTSIGNYAFSECSGLTSINLPGNITTLGNGAFSGCTNLSGITIPNGVTKIGDNLFYNCSNLVEVVTPEFATEIGKNAFFGCINLSSIVIPTGVSIIGESAFNNCSRLTDITVPDGVKTIGYKAFNGCSGITTITLPESVTTIGNSAFCGCSSLVEIKIPQNVSKIGSLTFSGCTNLSNITIPDSVTIIENNAFSNCSSLVNIIIPHDVTQIGSSAFSGCASLKNISLPEGITSIAGGLFNGCSNLTSITIPNGVTSIGYSAFRNCILLTEITIPDNVTGIGRDAFSGCTGLTNIVVPNGVTSIGKSAFSGCNNLVSITLPFVGESTTATGDNSVFSYVFGTVPDSLKEVTLTGGSSIPAYAFYGCNNLVNIVMPNSVTSIERYAFYGCSNLTRLEIPSSVTSVGSYAFCGCSSLENIVVPNSVSNIDESAFSECSGLVSITLPFVGRSVNAVGNGNKFKYVFGTVPNSLKNVTITGGATIADEAFEGCSYVKNIILPEGIISIGDEAFQNCIRLESIRIPSSVTSIGSWAFYECFMLNKVYISDLASYLSIDYAPVYSSDTGTVSAHPTYFCGAELYINGELLTDVTIPSGITDVCEAAFINCTSLERVIVPEYVNSIGKFAFDGCSNLRDIVITEGVTSIDAYALSECDNLSNCYVVKDTYADDWLQSNGFSDKIKYVYKEGLHYYNDTVTKEPTCSDPGIIDSICVICGDTREKDVPVINHTTVLCQEKEPNCIDDGNISYWKCNMCGRCFSDSEGNNEISEESTIIPATGHDYDQPTYVWADNNSKVTAEAVCKNDPSHIIAETVGTSSSTIDPTCYDSGETIYTAEFTNSLFERQTKSLEIPATGHSWSNPVYEWFNDYSMAKATRVCMNDASHVETETVETEAEVTKPATCDEMGETTYYAIFTNEAFGEQSITVENIGAFGHDWNFIGFAWVGNDEDGYTKAIVNYECNYDTSHTYTAEAEITTTTIDATCTDNGKIIYTATLRSANSPDGSFRRDSREVIIPAMGHDWDEGTVVTEPRCTEDGTIEYSCKRCGETKTAAVPALGHDLVRTMCIPATCTEVGNIEYWTCQRCHKLFSDDNCDNEILSDETVIPALGHTLVPTAAVEPTCTEAGNSAYWTCSVCGKYFSDAEGTTQIEAGSWIIPAKGHSLVKTDAKPATCTEPGNSAYWTCSVCGRHFSDAEGTTEIQEGSWVIPAAGHVWNDGVVTTEPTCTAEGEKLFTCTVCGATRTEVMAKLPHTIREVAAVAPTCTLPGNSTYYVCDSCGQYFADAEALTAIAVDSWVLPANGHTWGEWVVITAPDCVNQGSEQRTCTVCGATESQNLDPNGHTWADEYTIDQEPDCTTDGSKSRHCLFCDQRTDVEVIPALGHDWDTENVVFNWSEDLSSAEAVFTCKRDHSHVETLQAAVTSETAAGIITYTATVVFENATYTDTKTADAHEVIRIFGKSRYLTSIAAADHLKQKKGVSTFDSIVVASGDGFPDALSASYLAYKKDGPILLYGKSAAGTITDYINANLSPDGTVYIVGGKGAVPLEVEDMINGKVKRLSGSNRYATNIAVLDEAGVAGEDLLIASGNGFADALSASAAKRPIFLVGNTLTADQKKYLYDNASTMSGKVYLIGGKGAVSLEIEDIAKNYGTVKRLSGKTRYLTSIAVADEFFQGNVSTMVIANGNNFPDGLSGGPVAVAYDAPLILVIDTISDHAETYFKEKDSYRLVIMGGKGVISDETAGRIFGGTI